MTSPTTLASGASLPSTPHSSSRAAMPCSTRALVSWAKAAARPAARLVRGLDLGDADGGAEPGRLGEHRVGEAPGHLGGHPAGVGPPVPLGHDQVRRPGAARPGPAPPWPWPCPWPGRRRARRCRRTAGRPARTAPGRCRPRRTARAGSGRPRRPRRCPARAARPARAPAASTSGRAPSEAVSSSGRAGGQQPGAVAGDGDRDHLEAVGVERLHDRAGRHHRHLVLGRAAAVQDGQPDLVP